MCVVFEVHLLDNILNIRIYTVFITYKMNNIKFLFLILQNHKYRCEHSTSRNGMEIQSHVLRSLDDIFR